ncbi:hypothetical protein U5640_15460 [Streptomyces sp. SS7]
MRRVLTALATDHWTPVTEHLNTRVAMTSIMSLELLTVMPQ